MSTGLFSIIEQSSVTWFLWTGFYPGIIRYMHMPRRRLDDFADELESRGQREHALAAAQADTALKAALTAVDSERSVQRIELARTQA